MKIIISCIALFVAIATVSGERYFIGGKNGIYNEDSVAEVCAKIGGRLPSPKTESELNALGNTAAKYKSFSLVLAKVENVFGTPILPVANPSEVLNEFCNPKDCSRIGYWFSASKSALKDTYYQKVASGDQTMALVTPICARG